LRDLLSEPNFDLWAKIVDVIIGRSDDKHFSQLRRIISVRTTLFELFDSLIRAHLSVLCLITKKYPQKAFDKNNGRALG
jgi:hypothetical protein